MIKKILRSKSGITKALAIGIAAIVVIAAVSAGIYFWMLAPAPVKGPVMVYGAIHEFEIERMLDDFKKATGITADYIRLSAGELTARIRAEKDRPMADIFLGGPNTYHETLRLDGLLEKYISPIGAEIDKRYHSDPEGYWYGFYLGAIAFAVNKDWIKAKKLVAPKTWDDLLKPEFKGEIMMAFPYTSGTAYTIVCTQLFRLGEDAGWKYIAELDKQIKYYHKSGAAPARIAAAGEVGIGIVFGHDALKVAGAGYPLSVVYPPDTGWEIGGVSIIKGGPNTEAAKKFIDWVLGKDAGQIHTDLSFRISTRPDVKMRPGTVPLKDIKLVKFDFKWTAEQYDAIIAKWKALTGK
ncbi:MAG: spermidine/putrescine ABC transporter periplasmic substrate-binding protein [Candidatus Bathyarchaeota archaeon BA1]|nr:MAG: spermidine/putrescine ABC transporter periplasmic substrate-binding protein [Candidatus Bathyarchaeota archaeon BA1]